jgi:hypothetical protein
MWINDGSTLRASDHLESYTPSKAFLQQPKREIQDTVRTRARKKKKG